MTKVKPPPGFNRHCADCHATLAASTYEGGPARACDTHATQGEESASVKSLVKETKAQLSALYLDVERLGTLAGRDAARRLTGVLVVHRAIDFRDAGVLEQIARGAQSEKKPAGDAWGETGKKVLELLGGEE